MSEDAKDEETEKIKGRKHETKKGDLSGKESTPS